MQTYIFSYNDDDDSNFFFGFFCVLLFKIYFT